MQGILNISEAASLAMHTMVLMADEPDKVLSTGEAAGKFGASENHLSKVLQRLTKARLIKSVRGPKGGYMLARKPEDVTLLDVFEAIEGPFVTNNCLFDKEICDGHTCITGGLINSINTTVRKYFKSAKLTDLTLAFSICSSNQPGNGSSLPDFTIHHTEREDDGKEN